jgi:hypothetical protein
MGLNSASLVFGRELKFPATCCFGHPLKMERPTIYGMANLVNHLHDIHTYARQHPKLPSDGMKTCYNRLANCAGYHEGAKVWFYCLTCMKGKLPKLQTSWEGPDKVATQIIDVVCRIQENPRSRMMVVHLDRLAPYQGTARDDWLYGGSSRSCWRLFTTRTEPLGRRTRPIRDITSTALGKEEMVVCPNSLRREQCSM